MKRQDQRKTEKKVKKYLNGFNKALQEMNYVFNTLKDEDNVTEEMVREISDFDYTPKLMESLLKDINKYEDNTK